MANEPNLPQQYRPLSPWAYFGYQILYTIPVIGTIFLIIHAISRANINRRNFARSYFCILVIALVIFLITLATGAGAAMFGGLLGSAGA